MAPPAEGGGSEACVGACRLSCAAASDLAADRVLEMEEGRTAMAIKKQYSGDIDAMEKKLARVMERMGVTEG